MRPLIFLANKGAGSKIFSSVQQFLLKLLNAKKRNEIRNGKLLEITTIFGWDFKKQVEPAKADPFIKPEGGKVEKMRTHDIKPDDNVTNLTKKPELL
jgi:hypothetical protein